MPITPFHFGLGAACKAVLPKHFSFSIFCFTQVVIDAEVIYSLVRGDVRIHEFFHTYLGSTIVAAFCVITGIPLCKQLKRIWNARLDAKLKSFLTLPESISLVSACVGAFVGAYSHILLDSFMHADMKPFAPANFSNPMLGFLGFAEVHLLCVLAGIFGVLMYAYKIRVTTSRTDS